MRLVFSAATLNGRIVVRKWQYYIIIVLYDYGFALADRPDKSTPAETKRQNSVLYDLRSLIRLVSGGSQKKSSNRIPSLFVQCKQLLITLVHMCDNKTANAHKYVKNSFEK